jgi:voltage-gated potassium channel
VTDRNAGVREEELRRERWQLLEQIDAALDKPMIALAFVWLALLVLDLTRGLSPLLQTVSDLIWALFVLDFLLGIIIAPHRRAYLRRNWLTALSLLLPALRVLRLFRALRLLRATRAVRSLNLLRLLTSLNRGMRAIGATLGRHGVGYLIALTIIVTFAGAAGMAFFERPDSGGGLGGYGEAVWWTAMIMTSLGSEYWPKTIEGRILGFLLALYALATFSYITATIASYFVDQQTTVRREVNPPHALDAATIASLHAEIAELRKTIAELTTAVAQSPENAIPEREASER